METASVKIQIYLMCTVFITIINIWTHPIFSKVFERRIRNTLNKHLLSNELIHPNQSGFRANTHAPHLYIKLQTDWLNTKKKEKTMIVFIDFKKALMLSHMAY